MLTPKTTKLSAIVLAILATLLFIPEYRGVETSSAAVVYEGGVVNSAQSVLNSAQSTPRIEVHSGWGKTHLKVAIVPSGSPEFDEAMRNAVKLWYSSIKAFTALYGYRYLEALSYEFTDDSGDVTMQYVNSLPGNYCGLATWWYDRGSGMTLRAVVEVSKSCVGNSVSLAYVVAAHEYGHALGVDHATDSRDIMYPYVTGTAKLSTLNLYALAVVYSWVQGGVFTPPSERTVSLPSTIPYEFIEPSSPRRQVRVFIQSELGRVLLATHDVAFGSVFEMRAEEEISYSNLTKHVFTGWYRNDNRLSSSPNVRLRVTEDIDLEIRYGTWYFVRVTLPDGNHTGWVKRGEVLELKAAEFITLGERERMRFKTWSDGVTAQNRTFKVLSPLNITAVYAKEFYITVSSTHGSLEGLDGWYELGTRLELKPPEELVWDNGTRAVFSRWVGADSDKPATTVVVDGPLDITASYRVQYFVEILSRQPVSHASGWFDRGSTLTVDARPLIRPAGEGERYVFVGWMGVGEEQEVVVYVDGPKTLQAIWAKEYLVTITNVLEKLEAWVGEGRNLTIEAKQVLPEGEGRRHVFKGWAGDVDGYEGLNAWLTADRPRKVVQLYDEELLIRFEFEASDGKQVEAEAVVRHDSGVVYTSRGGDFWALKGGYEVVSIVYKGVDVKRSAYISVENPGTYMLPVRVYSLRLVVKDILGIPFAGAEVSVSNDEGVVEAEAYLDRDGEALLENVTHNAVNARLKTAIYTYGFAVDPTNEKLDVRLPLTPTSTALLVAASLAAGLALYLHIRRGIKKAGWPEPAR